MKRHFVQRNRKLLPIGPVHERKDEDPTSEKRKQDNESIESVQTGVVEASLNEYFANRNEWTAELCGEEAANEEIA